MNDVIVLLKNFTFVGASGQSWATDWVAVPAGYENWQLVIVSKSMLAGTNLAFTLQTTWDTDSATNTSATGAITTVTTAISNVTDGVGPMVRLFLNPGANSSVVFSAYLTPKST